GIGLLAGIDTDSMIKKFYFFKFPPRGRRELLLVKSVNSLYSMRESNVQMTPQVDLAFKLNVMLAPSYCSPEFLPRLFANIRDLYMEEAHMVDWNQMFSQLPSTPTPGSNWELVLEFVREMALCSK
ncbi:MAG: hypothetical protein Q7O66_05875, partial [Dehalococcoidia bacterium]|nr:hypothetical protein [Dehalococcoidia bacterium]